ncbi:MAG: RNA-binding S4 domain-containing protein, partial [Deltaproteobacteria bacterium]|nr:RNA-binding S4 domain-containing protein [Deltaproteobacteria bacterium]
MRVVEIEEEPIELYKILKFENMVQSGGEAKFVIAEGLVRVNGEIETRKRKKIFSGDIIEFGEETIRIITKGSGPRLEAQGTRQK